MEDFRWDQSVDIELARPGKYRVVTSTREAAEILIYRRPDSEGDALHAAKQACLKVMEGKRSPEHARRAFTAAAREAGLFVRANDDDPFTDFPQFKKILYG